MKNIGIKLTIVLMATTFIVSCSAIKNANNTQKGGAIGAGSGAAIGGIIGNNVGKGNTALGAIIGAVVGGAAGGYIGHRMDKQAQRIEEEIPGAEVTRVGEGINVVFNEDAGVHFETSRSDVKGTSAATLNSLVTILNEYPDTFILVEGHTDSAGPDEYNMNLSQRRAESVTNYLTSKGIAPNRLTTKWYGETQPKSDNSTVEGKAKNRRVEMVIVADENLKKEAINRTQ
ncbi:MAG: OmpA family protein [Cellulophaga sp.]|nr:OmpA family protein [Cellulophaga sp.]